MSEITQYQREIAGGEITIGQVYDVLNHLDDDTFTEAVIVLDHLFEIRILKQGENGTAHYALTGVRIKEGKDIDTNEEKRQQIQDGMTELFTYLATPTGKARREDAPLTRVFRRQSEIDQLIEISINQLHWDEIKAFLHQQLVQSQAVELALCYITPTDTNDLAPEIINHIESQTQEALIEAFETMKANIAKNPTRFLTVLAGILSDHQWELLLNQHNLTKTIQETVETSPDTQAPLIIGPYEKTAYYLAIAEQRFEQNPDLSSVQFEFQSLIVVMDRDGNFEITPSEFYTTDWSDIPGYQIKHIQNVRENLEQVYSQKDAVEWRAFPVVRRDRRESKLVRLRETVPQNQNKLITALRSSETFDYRSHRSLVTKIVEEAETKRLLLTVTTEERRSKKRSWEQKLPERIKEFATMTQKELNQRLKLALQDENPQVQQELIEVATNIMVTDLDDETWQVVNTFAKRENDKRDKKLIGKLMDHQDPVQLWSEVVQYVKEHGTSADLAFVHELNENAQYPRVYKFKGLYEDGNGSTWRLVRAFLEGQFLKQTEKEDVDHDVELITRLMFPRLEGLTSILQEVLTLEELRHLTALVTDTIQTLSLREVWTDTFRERVLEAIKTMDATALEKRLIKTIENPILETYQQNQQHLITQMRQIIPVDKWNTIISRAKENNL